MALSPEFGVPILPARLTEEQVQALDVAARMVMWLAGTANAERGTFYITTSEFATWAGCSGRQASRALEALEEAGWVCDLVRREHGHSGRLGEMWRRRNDVDASMAARVYQREFGARPHGDDRKRMGDEVGTVPRDVRLWAGVCQEWHAQQHNPMNVDGLLDAYHKKRNAVTTMAHATVANQEPDYSGYGSKGGNGGRDADGD